MSQLVRWDTKCSACDLRVGCCQSIMDRIDTGALTMPDLIQIALDAGMDHPDRMKCFFGAVSEPIVIQPIGPSPKPTGALKGLISVIKNRGV